MGNIWEYLWILFWIIVEFAIVLLRTNYCVTAYKLLCYCVQTIVLLRTNYCVQTTAYKLLRTNYCVQTTAYKLLRTNYCVQIIIGYYTNVIIDLLSDDGYYRIYYIITYRVLYSSLE